MADKTIGELTEATQVKTDDLFVLEQDSTGKKLSGQTLVSFLLAQIDGHGGITNITWAESGTTGNGKVHTGTIHYADETTSTFTISDGVKGDTGDAAHVWFKYAADLPTSDSDISDTPDNYIGVYSGTSETPPTAYTAYTWFDWKGDKGDTGTAARLINPTVMYVVSDSGTTIPDEGWQASVPIVAPGRYLWARTRLPWNDGNTTVAYSVSRFGIDGAGAVSSVNSIGPDTNGNVVVSPDNIIMSDSQSLGTHLSAIETSVESQEEYKPIHFTMNISSSNRSLDDERITEDMRLFNPVFGTPSAVKSAITYTTTATNITFSGTISGTTTFDFDLMKVDE